MGCISFLQTVTNILKKTFRKGPNTDIQEWPKLVGAYVRLTVT